MKLGVWVCMWKLDLLVLLHGLMRATSCNAWRVVCLVNNFFLGGFLGGFLGANTPSY